MSYRSIHVLGRDVEVVEPEDELWDDLVDHGDPYSGRDYLLAGDRSTRTRTFGFVSRTSSWSIAYILIFSAVTEASYISRTPDYGGPWIGRGHPTVDELHTFRRSLDLVLSNLGVASEVYVLSPWLPRYDDVCVAWPARPVKTVCVTDVTDLDALWARMDKGRRSDIRRGLRDLTVSFDVFRGEAALSFARAYAEGMDRLHASERWRFGADYFVGLSKGAANAIFESKAVSASGGASALFLRTGDRAAYLYATRWGEARGGPAACLWNAYTELNAAGVVSVMLGGGATDNIDDPLLRFKRSFSTDQVSLALGARSFNRPIHDAAVRRGVARPLPDCVVDKNVAPDARD